MTSSSFSRRRFLALAAASASPLTLAPASALSPIARTGGAHFQPTLNAYSFLEPLTAGQMDLFDVCNFCAQQNMEAVDLTGYFFPGYPKPPEDGYLKRMKRSAHELGLSISGTGVKNDFVIADAAVRKQGVQLTKDWIEVAARLGAPVIRVFAGPQQKKPSEWQAATNQAKRDDVEAWAAEAIRECADHGETFGVIVAVQNHGDFLSTGPEHLSLLQRVDHPWCGALVDTGKYFSEDPYADIALIAPFAVNWQIKEQIGSSLKTPPTDFSKLVKILHDSGYRGFVPIETLSMGRKDYDPAAEVIKVLKAFREAMANQR
jgi:sugar phosphate isomerase/epimerase